MHDDNFYEDLALEEAEAEAARWEHEVAIAQHLSDLEADEMDLRLEEGCG